MAPAAGAGVGGLDVAGSGSSPFAPGGQMQPNPLGSVAGTPNGSALQPDSRQPLSLANPGDDASSAPEHVGHVGGGGGRRMRPPDFRSMLQGDDGPTSGASANVMMPSSSPAQAVGAGVSGVNGVEIASSATSVPPPAQGFLAGPTSALGQDSSLPANPMNPAVGAANVPGPALGGNLGGGGLGGGRRMRPPDFRSILQGDEPAGVPANVAMPSMAPAAGAGVGGLDVAGSGSSPFAPGGQMQPNPLGSVAGIPNGSALQPDSRQPLSLANPGDDASSAPEHVGHVGGGGGRRMRPPDFRSMLQGDDGPTSAGIPKSAVSPDGAGQGPLDGRWNPSAANGVSQDNAVFGNAGNALHMGPTAGLKMQDDPGSAPKPSVASDPFGLDDLSGGYVPSAPSAPRRRRPRAGQL
ncbi:unnamed protein product [Symbiodinium natans]|uniref:Uncharacterized protein n=1 Tax=Symbiodinium natans TaxID=878477 RepID=A0A812V9S4_9DINO|nr:unnamed protein product [Symbiodinium natans]